MDIRSRYLALVNMLMFVLGLGLAVFGASLAAQPNSEHGGGRADQGQSSSASAGPSGGVEREEKTPAAGSGVAPDHRKPATQSLP